MVILLVAVFIVIVVVFIYNSLVKQDVSVKNAWAQIDVQLKRRHDLIPNLVETVKGYAVHEKTTLESVISARNVAAGASSIEDRGKAENMLTQTLKSLFAVVENYPDLKAISQTTGPYQ